MRFPFGQVQGWVTLSLKFKFRAGWSEFRVSSPELQVQGWFTWPSSSGLGYFLFITFQSFTYEIYVSSKFRAGSSELQVQGQFPMSSKFRAGSPELQVQGWDYIFFYNVSIVYLWDSRESQSVGLQGKSVSWASGQGHGRLDNIYTIAKDHIFVLYFQHSCYQPSTQGESPRKTHLSKDVLVGLGHLVLCFHPLYIYLHIYFFINKSNMVILFIGQLNGAYSGFFVLYMSSLFLLGMVWMATWKCVVISSGAIPQWTYRILSDLRSQTL